MATTLPPISKRPKQRRSQTLRHRGAQGLLPQHGLKPLPVADTELMTVLDKPSATPSPLSALQTPPSQWLSTAPPFTLPVLLLSVMAFIGLSVMGLLAAPLPNWSEGLLEAWQQGGNVTAPMYAHVWDIVYYRPQLPWVIACSAFLGPRPAMVVVALWLGLSLLGLPLMASGGGPDLVTSPVFGFAVGMIVAAGVAGWLTNVPLPSTSGEKHPKFSKKTSVNDASSDNMTLLQRAQVPSLVALRRQKKLQKKQEEKRLQQSSSPNTAVQGLSLRALLFRVVYTYRVVRKVITRLAQGCLRCLSAIRPQATVLNIGPRPWALPMWFARMGVITLLATATAHTVGWLGLLVGSLGNVGWFWTPTDHVAGLIHAQQFVSHWGAQLSTLTWGYDALIGLCALMVAQGLRLLLGVILFD